MPKKVTRSLLKEIVKECLVEILVEGLNSEEDEDHLFESIAPKPKTKKTLSKSPPRKIVSEAAIHEVSGGDSIMSDIFADTAATTLANQGMKNDARGAYVPADSAARLVQDSELTDLFEGSNNWAQLAFSSGKPNN
tara:strand:+ start:2296 stop:2703 length:408 start_codon:yes stop_codon:yes gene_type:complete